MLHQASAPLAIAALLAAGPAVASAQDPAAAVTPKSATTAVVVSLVGTVVPTALGLALANDEGGAGGWLLFYGAYLGPSTGYFYAGKTGRGLAGAGLRLGIVVATTLGVIAACGGDFIWSCDNEGAANVVALLGLAGFATSAVYDIAGAGRAVRQSNAKHEPRRVRVLPRVVPRDRLAGFSVRVTF